MVQTFLYVQDYKHTRTCDIINIYKLHKVKVQELSTNYYFLREGVGLKGRDVSESHLIPLQYGFNHLLDVKRSL